jgi:hypothetical protein
VKIDKLVAAAAFALAAFPLYAQQAPSASEPAAQTQPAQVDPAEEIKLLRARLDQLEAQQRKLAEQKEVSKTTEDMINDAAKHSQLLDVGSFSAGYKDNRFFIGSDDGRFNLRPWFHLQIRDAVVHRQDFKQGGNGDDTQNGFEIRRLKLAFDGNMFGPDLTYQFVWATARANGTNNVVDSTGTKIGTVANSAGGTPILEEAWVKYHFHDTPWYVRGGQFKESFLHDQIVSSRYQQSTERSLTADIFANGDAFTQGASVIWDPATNMRADVGFTDGMRSANTDFQQFPTGNFNYGAFGRFEFKAMGKWSDYGQIGAVDVKEPLLVFGAGADYVERGHANQVSGAIDAHYASPSGLSVYAAGVDRYSNHNFGIYTQSATGATIGTPDPAVANGWTNEYSVLLQAGWILDGHWEPFGRYEYMKLQGTAAGSKNYVQALTGGVNYYLVGHRAKFTAQCTYLPNGIPIGDGADDILISPHGKGEFSGVVQFQLLL